MNSKNFTKEYKNFNYAISLLNYLMEVFILKKVLMTGNEAIARGFYEAGGHLAASYPGSPTVEMLENIKKLYPEIYAEFSVNEKVAVEVGIGSSIAGGRTLVSMKHVGVNVAADPLMTFTQTKTIGGFVLMTGEDPGMASSQNEQDNRILGKFANMPIFDPSNSEEARQFVKIALDVSETYSTPSMLRISSRLCHSRSLVNLESRIEKPVKGFEKDISNFGMIPPNTFDKQYHMKERIEAIQLNLEELNLNHYTPFEGSDTLVITSGLPYENLMELDAPVSVLKLGIIYPLPVEQIKSLAKKYTNLIIIEELSPFIENNLKIEGINCEGKKYFSFTGELNIEDIRSGLEKIGVLESSNPEKNSASASSNVMGRLPMFCSGCPHRPVFDILKKSRKKIIGDIGCYSMGILFPLEVVDTVICMGASLGMIKGMQKVQKRNGIKEPLVAVIGDGTFYHSGMTGMANLKHQLEEDDNITIVILNNGTTAMTGGQPTMSSKGYGDGDGDIDIPKLLDAMGFDRVKIVDQFKYKEAKKIIDDEINHPGLSIVITTRPCALKYKIVEPHFYVDPSICIACRSCVKTNCPPIHMKEYEGFDKKKSSIDSTLCVGCSVCSQVCPVGAIKRS